MSSEEPDEYAYWRGRQAKLDPPPQANPDNPQPGFYRMRKEKNGIPVPVAVYLDKPSADPHSKEEIVVRVGPGAEAPEFIGHRANELWNSFYNNDISEEEYRRVAEEGQPWSDIDPGIGHNLQVGTPQLETLRDEIASALAGIDDYKSITSDEQSTRAQTKRARLLELSKQADGERETEKAPHLLASRAVDERWMPLIRDAKNGAALIRVAMEAWEDSKHKAAPKDYAPAPIKGAVGRAASVTTAPMVEIVKQDLVYKFFKEDPQVVSLLASLAQKAVDRGVKVPGTKIQQKAKIR
jgi:hypothetical protein